MGTTDSYNSAHTFSSKYTFLSMLWLKSWPGGVSGAPIAFFHIEGEVRSGTGGAIMF